ncbi:sigma factor regulator N-terminal domain-containing protein [Candidatus Saccharibacteria bacterium]|nr:sigma factor regulator N-terminal domain-containing protein [Candidatus Saccharibacteria bacterium]
MENPEPKLAKRHLNKHSSIKSGRTIGERRERPETANERLEARKKVKKRQTFRVGFTIVLFIVVAIVAIILIVIFLKNRAANEAETTPTVVVKTYKPTIEIIDENASAGGITTRMSEYIGQLETDLKDLSITPVKAVIPAGSIREVDIYLDGYTGFIKTTIDRGTGVTAEDTERMLRYLREQGTGEFQYIDVRIDGKAYWK